MNKHLTHIEEAVLFGGMEGAISACNMFYGLLNGESKLTMKVDGSPAIVIGYDPHFFVATKSFFNKTPIVYHSLSELASVENEELRAKLRMCLLFLQHLEFDGYLQGDFLFGPLEMTYNVESDWFRVQPNTLVYGFEHEYDFGIAFHTHYDKDMKVSYDYNFSSLKHPDPGVLLMDTSVVPYIPDVDWTPILGVNGLDTTLVNEIAAHPTMPTLITQFFNTKVRAGVPLDHPEMIDELLVWIYSRYETAIQKLKTDKARKAKMDEQWSCLQFFTPLTKRKLVDLLSFIHDLTVLKHDCINRLDKSSKIKTWVIRDNEYVPTGPEGYVISRGGEAYKLVDRSKFSFYNFSSNFVKGYSRGKDDSLLDKKKGYD